MVTSHPTVGVLGEMVYRKEWRLKKVIKVRLTHGYSVFLSRSPGSSYRELSPPLSGIK